MCNSFSVTHKCLKWHEKWRQLVPQVLTMKKILFTHWLLSNVWKGDKNILGSKVLTKFPKMLSGEVLKIMDWERAMSW